jgi:hypothetical protein
MLPLTSNKTATLTPAMSWRKSAIDCDCPASMTSKSPREILTAALCGAHHRRPDHVPPADARSSAAADLPRRSTEDERQPLAAMMIARHRPA